MSWLDVARTLPSAVVGLLMLAATLPLAAYAGVITLGPRVAGPLALRLGVRTAMLLSCGFAIVIVVATVAVLRTGVRNRAARFERMVTTLAGELSAISDPTHSPPAVEPRLALAVMMNHESKWAMLMTISSAPSLVARTIDSLSEPDATRVMYVVSRLAPQKSSALMRRNGGLELLLISAVRGRDGTPVGTVVVGLETMAETADAVSLASLLLGWTAALLLVTIGASIRLVRLSVSERVTELVVLLRSKGRPSDTARLPLVRDELQQLRDEVDRTVEENVRLQNERERYYEAIVERLPEAVLVCSGETIRFANAAAVRLLGAPSPERLVGTNFFQRLTPATPDALGGVAAFFVLARDDGPTRHVEVMTGRLSGSDEDRVEIAIHDVTSRVRADIALARSEAMYRQLFDGAPIGIAVLDSNLTVHAANPDLLRQFGRSSRAEIIGRPLSMSVKFAPGAESRLKAALASAGPAQLDVSFAGADGNERSAMLTVQQVRTTETGAQYELLWLDLTAQRALELQLRDAQKLEAVGQLSGGIAHVFNNLLTILMANAGVLRAVHGASVEVQEIEAAALRGAVLVRKLRAFGRRHDLMPRAVSLNVVIADVRAALGDALPSEVVTEWPADLPDTSLALDRDAVRQVFVALATNAVEAMHGVGRLRVGLRRTTASSRRGRDALDTGADYVEISVSDSGPGLTPETRARAFEPFFTTKSAERGMGMGLAIVHGLVTQMGGEVSLRDAAHGGAVASVMFPISREPDAVATAHTRVAGRPRSVLLVEDDPSVRRVSARLLEHLGLTVTTAVHGKAALDQLHLGPAPDLVVTDVMMPEMGGIELVHAIRQHGWSMPILIVSGYAAAGVAAIAAADARIAVLPKPWSAEDMMRAIAMRFELSPRLDGDDALQSAHRNPDGASGL